MPIRMLGQTETTPGSTGDGETDPEPLLSTTDKLRRIDFSGTIWFAAGLVATVIPLAGLLADGWRPTKLQGVTPIVWWAGLLITLAALGCLAWAGCPVLGRDLEESNRNKSVAVRIGVIAYLAGGAAALLAVLLD